MKKTILLALSVVGFFGGMNSASADITSDAMNALNKGRGTFCYFACNRLACKQAAFGALCTVMCPESDTPNCRKNAGFSSDDYADQRDEAIERLKGLAQSNPLVQKACSLGQKVLGDAVSAICGPQE